MFSLKVSLNGACEEMGSYNDTHLLALLMCVCVCVCVCVWGQFLVNYCFLLKPFPCALLGLVPHSENDPWPAHTTGNIVSVMRMPNVPRVAMQQKPALTSHYSAVHSDRGNLSHMQLVAGVWTQCRRSPQPGAEVIHTLCLYCCPSLPGQNW